MKYAILLIFTGILSLQLNSSAHFFEKKRYLDIKEINELPIRPNVKVIYKASLTGNKKGLKKKIKSTLRKYGLLHLLTPSGLHLSSLMPLLLFPNIFQILLLFLFFLFIQSYESYLSMERVIIYSLISKVYKYFKILQNQELIFFYTFTTSLLIGNATSSPGSFNYSLLFWGTIILFRYNPIKLLIFLNLSQHFMASIHHQEIYLSSILVNPIFSSLYLLIFPFLIINLLPIINITSLIEWYLEVWLQTLVELAELEQTYHVSLSLPVIIGVIFFCYNRFWKSAVLLLSLNITELNTERTYVKNESSRIDISNCKYEYYQLKCKKKPFKRRAF